MGTYQVIITEHLTHIYVVDAKNRDEAETKAVGRYEQGDNGDNDGFPSSDHEVASIEKQDDNTNH